jgi:hypothetical protein
MPSGAGLGAGVLSATVGAKADADELVGAAAPAGWAGAVAVNQAMTNAVMATEAPAIVCCGF